MNLFHKITSISVCLMVIFSIHGAVQTGIADSLIKIKNDEKNLHLPSEGVNLDMAGNEAESFQILLRSDKTENVSININGLNNMQIRIWTVVDRFLDKPVSFVNPAGFYPDALRKNNTVTVKPDMTERFWITVRTPENMKKGIYKGEIILTGKNFRKNIPLTVKVRNFSLPHIGTFQVDAGLWEQFIMPVYQISSRDEFAEFIHKNWDFMSEYRISPRQQPHLIPDNGNSLKLSENYKNFVTGFEKYGFNYLNLPGAEFQKKNTDFYQRLNNYVKSNPFVKKYGLIYYADEPWGKDTKIKLAAKLQNIKKNAPDVKFMVTCPPDDILKNLVDIYCIPMTELTPDIIEKIKVFRREGSKFFGYLNTIQFSVDGAPMPLRLFFMRHFDLGFTGSLFWCMTYWKQKFNDNIPLLDPQNFSASDLKNFGTDGQLLYPGKDGFLPSVRLENARDGIEDFEYLSIAEKLAKTPQSKAAIEKIMQNIRKNFPRNIRRFNFKNSPENFRKIRTDIANFIEKNKQ